jgi:hypothetical protein
MHPSLGRVLLIGRHLLVLAAAWSLLAEPADAQVPARPQARVSEGGATITVRGEAFDSTLMRPLVRAAVVSPAAGNLASADSAGRFVIEGLPAGRHSLVLYHPRLDTLGLTPIMRTFEAGPGDEVSLRFDLPGVGFFQGLLCPEEPAPGSGPGILSGVVLDRFTTLALPGAAVVADFDEPGGSGQRITRAADDGGFTLCGLPTDGAVRVSVFFPGSERVEREVDLGTSPIRLEDFALQLTTGGRMVGKVLDHSTGQPVEAAVVRVKGTDIQAITGGSGRFRFEELASADVTLEVEHLAYGTTEYAVPVSASRTMDVELRVSPTAIEVEGITVTVRSFGLERQGFYRREEMGFGHHFTRAQLVEDDPFDLITVLRKVPGLYIRPRSDGRDGTGWVLQARPSNGRGYCNLDTIVNGVHMPGWDFNDFRPEEISGLEVYPRAIEVPIQYQTLSFGGGCGAILIWTG